MPSSLPTHGPKTPGGITANTNGEPQPLVEVDGSTLLLDVQADGATDAIGLGEHPAEHPGADAVVAILGQESDVDELDVVSRSVDDEPANRSVVDEHDLPLSPRMVEFDRHRLGPKLHADQPVEDLRTQGAQILTS